MNTPHDTFAPRWAEYRRLRRVWLITMAGALPCSLAVAFLLVLKNEENAAVLGALSLPFVVGFVACGAVNVATWIRIMSWRCPRCGNRFAASWGSAVPGNRCNHCSLRVGARSDESPAWTRVRID